jgi:hypothetical protein
MASVPDHGWNPPEQPTTKFKLCHQRPNCRYLEKQEDLTLLGNTEEIFFKTNDSLHLPAQAASVANQIASGPNTSKTVRRLKLGNRPWPSEDDVEVSSTACVNVGGYSVHAATVAASVATPQRLSRFDIYTACFFLPGAANHCKL